MDWDPFAMDEPAAPPAAAPTPNEKPPEGDGAKEQSSGAIKMGSVNVDKIFDGVMHRLNDMKPWKELGDVGDPDLRFHINACDENNWKHTAIELKIGEGIAYIVFNRPNENNTTIAAHNQAFNDAICILHKRTDIRIVVITAKGKFFSAGAEQKWSQAVAKGFKGDALLEAAGDTEDYPHPPARTPEQQKELDALYVRAKETGNFPDEEAMKFACADGGFKSLWNLATLPQLVVGVAQGSAMGNGVGILCACDVVIMDAKAYCVLSEVKNGTVPALIAPYVCAKVGPKSAKRIMQMGIMCKAEECLEMGLCNYISQDANDANNILKKVCDQVSEVPFATIRAAKKLCWGVMGAAITEDIMYFALKQQNVSMQSEEFAQSDKRPWAQGKNRVKPLDTAPWQ